MRSAVWSSLSGGSAERRRIELAAAPARAPLEQLRPRGRDGQQRDVRDPVDELVHEVEQALVRPVEVLEDDDERPLLGHRLEKAPPGGEGRLPTIVAELRLGGEADEGAQLRLDPVRVARIRQDVGDSARRASARPRAGVSCSTMPACALTISESAQSVTPSPYARQRPWRQVTSSGSASAMRDSSYTRRLLPMPGTPTSVSSCGVRSCRARSNASRTTLSSRSRPTSSARASCATSTPKRECAVSGLPHRDRLPPCPSPRLRRRPRSRRRDASPGTSSRRPARR